MPTDAETAAFETGIKFGALYHQFAGTPMSAESAESLATAIEESIENQPHARDVSVAIDVDRIERDADEHGYVELTGAYMDVEMLIVYGDREARAEMSMVDGYPLMRLVSVS